MKSILPFLKELRDNNNRDWFQANKKRYETSQKEISSLVNEVIADLSSNEPELADLQAKDCLFRIYRDVRFSKDKSPYKTGLGAVIAPGGRKSPYGCYYIHLEPGSCFLAGGIYLPQPQVLQNIRQEIDYNFSEITSILEDPAFKKLFNGLDSQHQLKTTPKGYEADNPAIDLLKLKSFTVSRNLKDADIESANFKSLCLKHFAEIRKLNLFLNRAVDSGE